MNEKEYVNDFWELTGQAPTYDADKIILYYLEAVEQYKNDKSMLKRLNDAREAAVNDSFVNWFEPQKDILFNKIEDVYNDFEKRCNVDCWRTVFDDMEILKCQTALEYIRTEIITFFFQHDFIPKNVWEFIDERLFIMRDFDDLRDDIPITFLAMVRNVLSSKPIFDYDRISMVDKTSKNKNPDDFLNDLFLLSDMISDNFDDEEIQKKLESLEKSNFKHIFLEAEKLNFLIKTEGNDELVEALCNQMIDDESDYVRSCVGCGLWYLDRIDEAYNVWKNVLSTSPTNHNALMGIAKYMYSCGYYEQAKDTVLDTLEAYEEDEEAINLLKDINNTIMNHYLDMYEENEDDIYSLIQYVSCLAQNEMWEEVIDILKDVNIENSDDLFEYDINMFLGRAYLNLNKKKAAIKYLQKWIKCMMLMPYDGSEDYKYKMQHYPIALAILSETYYDIGDIDKAVYFMEQSVCAYDQKDPERVRALTRLADFYIKQKRYSEALTTAESAVKADDCYALAYSVRMEAAFFSDNKSLVIKDYYTLLNIAPEFEDTYVYTAMTYLYMNMPLYAEDVLKEAKQAKIYDKRFAIIECIVDTAKSNLNTAEKIKAQFERYIKENDYLNEYTYIISCFYFVFSFKYKEEKQYYEFLKYLEKAESIYHSKYFVWEIADLYFYCFDEEKALQLYESIYDELKHNSAFLCDYACCLQYNNMWEKSKDILDKAYKLDEPKNADIYMSRYYKHLYIQTDKREHYKLARKYIDSQIEKQHEIEFAYNERANLLECTENQETLLEAIEDIKKLIELNYGSDVENLTRLIKLYCKVGNFSDAILKINELYGIAEPNELETAATAYIRMNGPQYAEKILNEIYNKTGDSALLKHLAEAAFDNANYSDAIKFYKKCVEIDDEEMENSAKLAMSYLLNGSYSDAKQIYDTIRLHPEENIIGMHHMAFQYFDIMLNPETAIECIEETLPYISQGEQDYFYATLALLYRFMNDSDKASLYADKLYNFIIQSYNSIEEYLDVMYGVKYRINNVILYYIGIGDFEKAEEYINAEMKNNILCSWCNKPCCSDLYERLAIIRFLQGDFEGMKDVCKELLARYKNNYFAKVHIEREQELIMLYEKYNK